MRRPTSVASQNITERALGWWLVFISLVEFRQSFLKEAAKEWVRMRQYSHSFVNKRVLMYLLSTAKTLYNKSLNYRVF